MLPRNKSLRNSFTARSVARPLASGMEALEARQLLAGDLAIAIGGMDYSDNAISSQYAPALQAEGEGQDAIDLVAFAKAVAETETRLFCASWASECVRQLSQFEDGGKYLPYVEVGTPQRTGNAIAAAENISVVPTWEFPDASRFEGVLTVDEVAQRVGIFVSMGSSPSFDVIPAAFLTDQSPLHIPIDAYDPNGGPLTVTVEVQDPDLLTADVLSGNRSVRFSTADYGAMVFELFEQRAPRPTGRVIELAEDGFYDGVSLHRVVDNFVIQGGDPTGTGSGGSTLGDFDDQFDLELQHNATGILSYAKSSDDTNDSQFFIAEGQQRSLDYNHSVFGALVEGESVREAISETATINGSTPAFRIDIASADIFEDSENSVLLLRPKGVGVTQVSVTVTDGDGNMSEQSFSVTVVADTFNAAPFLDDVADQSTTNGTPVQVQLTSQDQEGDAVVYSVQTLGGVSFEVAVDEAGLVTVTPPEGFVGQLQIQVRVQQDPGTLTNSPNSDDNQVVAIEVRSAFQNASNPLDANDDGFVTPLDALLVINFLNGTNGNGSTSNLPASAALLDVNGDLFVSPVDALLIINHLNSSAAEGESQPEGEAAQDDDVSIVHASGLDQSMAAAGLDILLAELEKDKRRGWLES